MKTLSPRKWGKKLQKEEPETFGGQPRKKKRALAKQAAVDERRGRKLRRGRK